MSPLRSSRWNRLNLAMFRCCGVCTDPKSPAEFQVANDMLASGNGSLSCRVAAAEGEGVEEGEDGEGDEEGEAGDEEEELGGELGMQGVVVVGPGLHATKSRRTAAR